MLEMLLNVILLSSIVIVTASQISYTNESLSLNKVPCMTDCISNWCVIGFSKITSICYPGSTPGLQYYTALDRTQKKLCKSRCGKFDNTHHDWCYVSDHEWDYCNSEMGTKILKDKAFTKTKGPCKDKCEYKLGIIYSSIWCYTYWGGWDHCDPETFSYVHTKTRQGLDCVGLCGAHEKKKYNWCMSSEEKEARCAPMARNFTSFNHLFDQTSILEKKDGCRIRANQKKIKHYSLPSGVVARYAKLLEYPNIGLSTGSLREDGNAIKVYTVMPHAFSVDPMLPIVVRARVTSETIRSLGSHLTGFFTTSIQENLRSLNKNDQRRKYITGEDGHIISTILGGSRNIFNFAAPTTREPLPMWYNTEVLIRDFIVRTKGWAKITVVIVYSNILESGIPDGYAVDFSLYNYDNTLYRECNDYYYSNNK